MIYQAYCVPAGDNTVNLCIFLEGFDTQEHAESFLDALMTPWHDEYWPISNTVH